MAATTNERFACIRLFNVTNRCGPFGRRTFAPAHAVDEKSWADTRDDRPRSRPYIHINPTVTRYPFTDRIESISYMTVRSGFVGRGLLTAHLPLAQSATREVRQSRTRPVNRSDPVSSKDHQHRAKARTFSGSRHDSAKCRVGPSFSHWA